MKTKSTTLSQYNRFIAWLIVSSILCWTILSGVFAEDQWYVVPVFLNVRSEGRYGTPIITSLKRGDRVTIIDSLSNGWKKISLESGTIWYVNGRYLSMGEPVAIINKGGTYKVSVANVFVRGEWLKQKVAVLRKNDSLEALDSDLYQGKWIRVKVLSSSTNRYENRIGYISKNLVEPSDSIASEEKWNENTTDSDSSMFVPSKDSSSSDVSSPTNNTPLNSTGVNSNPNTNTNTNNIMPNPTNPTVNVPVSSGSNANQNSMDLNEINGIIKDIFK